LGGEGIAKEGLKGKTGRTKKTGETHARCEKKRLIRW